MRDSSQYSPDDKKPSPSELQLLGRQLGGCQITDFIGRGGMGTVYKANQMALNREVAIKILTIKDQDEKAIRWFLSEARSIAALEDPNIIQVHFLDYDDEIKTYYIVMQYINGPSLDVLVRRSDNFFLPWEEAAEYIMQAASGLGSAHKKKIIHRDVKPSNIMITQEGKIKITDFGLAKEVITEEANNTGSVIVGTPLYMAPEQCVGGNIDHRADIYSLGASFYYLVTGKPPIVGENTYEILEKQITEMPVSPDEVIEGIPGQVAHIILRMLAKNPQDRFQTCEDVVANLRAVLYESEHSSPVPSAQGRPQVHRVSGVDKIQLIKALREIAINRYRGIFTFRSREGILILHLEENGVNIMQGDEDQEYYDMEAMAEEYAQYSKIELASLLLTQILSWETFNWEFAEETPPKEFFKRCLGVTADVHSLLLGYAGIIQILVDIARPGILVLSTPLNSCAIQYSRDSVSVASPTPGVYEATEAITPDHLEEIVGKIASGNFSMQYFSPSLMKIEGASLEDSLISFYFEILYQVPDFTFFQHLMPNFDAIFPSDPQNATKELNISKVKTMGEKIKRLLTQTFNQYQHLEHMGIHKYIAILITCAVLKERIDFAVSQLGVLASIFEQRGTPNISDMLLQTVEALSPYNSKMLEQMAASNEEIKNYERAAELWTRCGKMCEALAEHEHAHSCYERARELTPNNSRPVLCLFHMYMVNEAFEEALEISQELIPKLRKAGERDLLIEICQDILKVHPEQLSCYQELIHYHLDRDDTHQAISLYEKMAEIYDKQGNKNDVIHTYQKILRLNPSRADIREKLLREEGKSARVGDVLNSATTVINKVERVGVGVVLIGVAVVILAYGVGREWMASQRIKYFQQRIALGEFHKVEKEMEEISASYYFLGYDQEAFTLLREQKQKEEEREIQKLQADIAEKIRLYGENHAKILEELDKLRIKHKSSTGLSEVISLAIKETTRKKELAKNNQGEEIFQEAEKLIAQKNFDEADAKLRQLLTIDPTYWFTRVREARDLLKRRRDEHNEEVTEKEQRQKRQLQRIQGFDKDSIELEEVIEMYQRAIDVYPESPMVQEIREYMDPFVKKLEKVKSSLADAEKRLRNKQYYQATLALESILNDSRMRNSQLAKDITFPLLVETSPITKVKCYNHQREIGISPFVYRYSPDHSFDLSIENEGFRLDKIERSYTEQGNLWKVVLQLERVPVWQATTDGIIESPVIVDKQRIFLGSRDNHLYAFDKSGRQLWKFYTGDRLAEITGSIHQIGKELYFSTLAGTMYALDIEKNTSPVNRVNWRAKIPGKVFRGGPNIYKNFIAVGSRSGYVYIIRRAGRTSDIVRKFKADSAVETMPEIHGSRIYFTSEHSLYGYSIAKNKKLWSKKLGDVSTNPLVYGNRVYVANSRGIFAYNAKTGREDWNYRISGGIKANLAVASGTIYAAGREQGIYAIDAESGRSRWQTPTEYGFQAAPIVYGDVIFAGGDDFNVYAFSRKNGDLLWKHLLPEKVYSSPACDGKNLYVCAGKKLFAIWVEDILAKAK